MQYRKLCTTTGGAHAGPSARVVRLTRGVRIPSLPRMRPRSSHAQLAFDFTVDAAAATQPVHPAPALHLVTPDGPPRWTFSRLALHSRHHKRIVERLELARHHFPELEGLTIRVGLVKKRGILGWGSLDPAHPGVWVRPRRLDLFTLAHEFTHLLQARGLVPGGERACDLYALARTPELIDHMPSYLALPDVLRRLDRVPVVLQHQLCAAARDAIAAREAGDRRYIARFERLVREACERAGMCRTTIAQTTAIVYDENIALAT